jgi:hypothetical protein
MSESAITPEITSGAENPESAEVVEMSLSAAATVKTDSLKASASAIGLADVEGDSDVRLSALGVSYAKGNASIHQTYASALIAGNDVAISQGGTPFVVGRTISFDQGGSVVAAASNVSVSRGFVGLLLAGKADVSDDSKVLLTGRGVAILAAVMLGGFALVAVAIAFGANRVSNWRPEISLPELPDWLRRAA